MLNLRVKKYILLLGFFVTFFGLNLYAQQKSKLVKLVDKVYKIIEGDSAKPKSQYFFVIPMWGVSPETGIKLGVSAGYVFKLYEDSSTRPSLIKLNTSYTSKKQFNLRPFADVYFKNNQYNLKAQYVFNDFNERYWGIGSLTSDSSENYDFNQHKINVRLTRQIIRNLFLGPQILYEKVYNIEFSEQSETPESKVYGINGYDVFGAGLALAFDNRNNVYSPNQGAYLELSNFFFYHNRFSDFRFDAISIDLRKYFPIGKENVFALQGVAAFNAGEVPYRQMGTIGSENYMRGYYQGRYRDNHMLTLQSEFRFKIWGPLNGAAFVGAGNVANEVKNLNQNLKPNYGIGIRGLIIRKEKMSARLDLGFGEGKIRGFYFTMLEAF
jgi:outer membrane protein assembly factor BamA